MTLEFVIHTALHYDAGLLENLWGPWMLVFEDGERATPTAWYAGRYDASSTRTKAARSSSVRHCSPLQVRACIRRYDRSVKPVGTAVVDADVSSPICVRAVVSAGSLSHRYWEAVRGFVITVQGHGLGFVERVFGWVHDGQ